MSKRVGGNASGAPDPKQPRVGEHSARPHGRAVLNVGGTYFESCKTTLEGASSYFSSCFQRWDGHADEPLFVDGDGDAFQVLLSYMRFGKLTLPRQDEGLCERVLLQAEYLGMDALLSDVKARAFKHMHPDTYQDEARPLAAAFDEEVGSLTEAIDSHVLPARYFTAVPKPPEAPKRMIKALCPAASGLRAMFTNGIFDYGEARGVDEEGNPGEDSLQANSELLHIVSWALVEYPDGSQAVDAVVQRDLQRTRDERHIDGQEADTNSHSHLHLASEQTDEDGDIWTSWLVVPPRTPEQMLAIPYGSVRGVWAVPALTSADVGKTITIAGDTVTVNGERRTVKWQGEAPQLTGETITSVSPWSQSSAGVTVLHSHEGLHSHEAIELPRLANSELKEVDCAFARVDAEPGGNTKTTFYLPVASNGPYHESSTVLMDVRHVIFGALRFLYFAGAKRS